MTVVVNKAILTTYYSQYVVYTVDLDQKYSFRTRNEIAIAAGTTKNQEKNIIHVYEHIENIDT